MSDRAGFLKAIAAEPGDDALRLIFADWLDERGDPLGAFLRLQLELEPLRRPCAEPWAELERVRRLRRIPPGEDHPREGWPLAWSLQRESAFLKLHRGDWLGPAAPLEDEHENFCGVEFRRGLPESATVGLSCLLARGADLRAGCPTLQEMIVFGSYGRGADLAACPALADLPGLLLAGWLTATDAAALAASPHLANLQTLTVWLVPGDGPEAYRPLAHLPRLRRLRLVQMWGGLDAQDPELDRQADALADHLRHQRPEVEVEVERPFARRFPLDGVHIGRGIDAGYLPDGRAVLVDEGNRPVLMYFDDDGNFVGDEQLDFRDRLHRPPKYSWYTCDDEELIEVLQRDLGFRPGPIFVHEFHAEESEVGLSCWGMHEEQLANPAAIDPGESEDVGSTLYWWWSTRQFVLPFGNCYWADGLGRVHSS